MWGRPLKTHPHMGGGYPTLQEFCAVYGLNLHFGFWMPFCLTDEEKKTDIRPRYTQIYAFCLVLVYLCALPCLV